MQLDFTNTITGEYPVTIATIKAAHPLTMFPTPFNEAFDGWEPVQSTAQPAHDAATHKAVELAPVEDGGVWSQAWGVVALTQQEIDDARRALVPASVTMRQARLALLGAGLIDDVEAAIAALPSPQKEAAKIEWEYSQEVQRHNGFVSVLAPMLGMTAEQTDALFIGAATL